MKQGHRLESFLQEQGALYDVDHHPTAITAQETAEAEQVPGMNFVKVVIVKADGDLAMICVPAPHEVDLGAVAEHLGADEVELAAEDDFEDVFDDCEVGAMPPFGNLYDLPVYLDDALTVDDYVVFNAGTHKRVVKMPLDEFQRLARPQRGRFSHHAG